MLLPDSVMLLPGSVLIGYWTRVSVGPWLQCVGVARKCVGVSGGGLTIGVVIVVATGAKLAVDCTSKLRSGRCSGGGTNGGRSAFADACVVAAAGSG
jgi:hypothetical protein